MSDAKSPAEMWYFGDWKRDIELQSCSLAARGLWMELLAMMHFATPRGYLRTAAGPIPDARLSSMVSAGEGESVPALLAELEAAKVFSRAEDGAIYNRRMVRQADLSFKRGVAGRLGGFATAKQAAKSQQSPVDVDAVVGAEVVVAVQSPEEEFVSLWSACAKKKSKGQARRTYLRLRRQGSLPALDLIVSRLIEAQRTEDWTRERRRYQPHLATWLNAEGWEDEHPAAPPNPFDIPPAPIELEQFTPIQSPRMDALRAGLRKRLKPEQYRAWIEPLVPVSDAGDELFAVVGSMKLQHEIEDNARQAIDAEASVVLGPLGRFIIGAGIVALAGSDQRRSA